MKDLTDYSFTEVKLESGIAYPEFRKKLVPSYLQVWVEILLGFTAIVLSILLSFKLTKLFHSALVSSILAIVIGYFFSYLNLFLHEASHFGLHKNRKVNDLLATLCFSLWVGTSIDAYRAKHWKHHQLVGDETDPENSYQNDLNLTFIIGGLTFWNVLKKIIQFRRFDEQAVNAKSNVWKYQLIGLFLHISILVFFLMMNSFCLVVAWIAGVGIVFPFVSGMRQLLEHRSEEAKGDSLFYKTSRAPTNRMFGQDFFSRTFGGAGFNRHLLHHWDPTISYTAFVEMEKFLMASNVRSSLLNARTTYLETFLKLFNFQSPRELVCHES